MPDPLPDGARTYRAANPGHRAVRLLMTLRPVSRATPLVLPHLDSLVSWSTRGRHTFASLMSGMTAAEITTRGSRSGRPPMVRLLGFPADDGFVVIASNYGRARHPAWYYNLLAHPQAELLVHGRSRAVTAELTTGQRRTRLWERSLTFYPGWAHYQQWQENREIGVFLLREP